MSSVPLKVPRLITLFLAFAFAIVSASVGKFAFLALYDLVLTDHASRECVGQVEPAKE